MRTTTPVALVLAALSLLLACEGMGRREAGAIRAHAVPGQGELYLDGVSRGPTVAQLEIGGLEPGPHVLELRRGNQIVLTVPVEVRAGAILDVPVQAQLPTVAAPTIEPVPQPAPVAVPEPTPPTVAAPMAAGGAPEARTGDADVRGSLAPEAIRRVVRRHMNEVRFCYERALARAPTLAGRVTVAFVVAPSGSVSLASISSTTMNDAEVEACIVHSVRRWTFPAPEGGGIVQVSYPFVFDSEG